MTQSYQKGTIQERSRQDGTIAYRLAWRERQQDGSWRQKTMTMRPGTTAKEARIQLDQVLVQLNGRNGQSAEADQSLTFGGFVDAHWETYQKGRNLRPGTIDGYKSSMTKWILPFFGGHHLKVIRPEMVSEFMGRLIDADLSDKYRKNIYTLLTLLFDLALTHDFISRSPIRPRLHRPKVERKEKPVFPMEKVRAFFDVLPEPWRFPIAVLMLTGIRQGELLGLLLTGAFPASAVGLQQ